MPRRQLSAPTALARVSPSEVRARPRARRGARSRLAFPYFLERTAPVSGLSAMVEYEAHASRRRPPTGIDTVRVGVRVPVTSLCPCSKEISDYGAHNQRGYVDIEVELVGRRRRRGIWLEDLIEVAEAAGSAPIYSLLKRADERHVTMQAYENPAFVEDIARDVAVALREDSAVRAFDVTRHEPGEHPQPQRRRDGPWSAR